MDPGSTPGQHRCMVRVLILWSRPGHLSISEADAWVRAELRKITTLTTVTAAELTPLGVGPERHACPYDWMLALELDDDATIENGPCAEWLGDLRLLGMRPAVVVPGETVPLTGGA